MYTTKTTLINKISNGDEIGWQEFENTYRNLMLSVASVREAILRIMKPPVGV